MLSLTELNYQPLFLLSILEIMVALGYTIAQLNTCLLIYFFYSHEDCSKSNLTTNPITSFETMLVFIDLANDYCHIKIKNKRLFLLNQYMHSLRQLTLCLHCFGFTLVPDWNN